MKAKVIHSNVHSSSAWPNFWLFFSDIVTLVFSFWFGRITHALYYGKNIAWVLIHWWGVAYSANLIVFPMVSCIALFWFYYHGHYGRRKAFWDETGEIILITTVLAALNATFAFSGGFPLSRLWLFSTWLLVLCLLPITRMSMHWLIAQRKSWQRPYVLLGCGENAVDAVQAFASEPLLGYHLQAIVIPSKESSVDKRLPADVPHLVLDDHFIQTLTSLGNPHIVLALGMEQWKDNEPFILNLAMEYPDLTIAPPMRGLPIFGMETLHFFSQEIFMLRSQDNLARPGPRLLKRLFDVVAASFLVVFLSPLLLFLALWIGYSDRGPVFFVQERIGRNGHAFPCYKFRSMLVDAEQRLQQYFVSHPELYAEYQRNFKLREDPRVTRVGRFLRRTSLDELPQLFNVLRGQMSLVGPRPLLERELSRYGRGFTLYQQVYPGITGLWQTSGRSETSFAQRAALDAWYVKNWSLWYDIVILLRTIKVLLHRTGAY
jgi:Undecaprenyl-phosphate galactose phosphotransferase, WbaP/exopolysaccharide biosynthesis polyprenyl glycosylphosphotransferase